MLINETSSRIIVTKLCNAIDEMNSLITVDISMSSSHISMILLLLDEIDNCISIIKSNNIADQFPEKDRDEFISYVKDIESVVKHNRRSIMDIIDAQLIYKQLNILGY